MTWEINMRRSRSGLSRWQYLSGIALILLLASSLRLYYLEADAPIELSPTQELNLDGPVTIAAGRDRAVFGDWDPYPGPLQPYRYYPAMNWFAYVFFAVLGTGFWQANLLSVVSGLLSIVFVTGFANDQFGRRVSLMSGLFMASNYVYVFYNRDPMAYTTVACGLSLTLYLWGKGLRRPIWFFFSGLVMVFNALFIKLPGVAIFPAALLGFFTLWWPQRRTRKIAVYSPALLFAAGSLVMATAWFLLAYLPHSRVVSQAYYVRTFSQSQTLIDNIRFAIQSLLLFGVDFGFNLRMLPLFALSYGYMFYRAGQLISRERPNLPVAELVSLCFLASTITMLLFSGIRPLRFQILLVPPMSIVAALALDAWLRRKRIPLPGAFGRLFPVYIQVGLAYFFYQLLMAFITLQGIVRFQTGPVDERVAPSVTTLYTMLAVGLIVAIVGTFAYLWRVVHIGRHYVPLPSARTRRGITLLILSLMVAGDLYQYWTWARTAEASIVVASRQLAEDFDAETTVLAGSYAYTLALENDFPAVWFYGHSSGEAILSTFFTHVAMETASPLSSEDTNDQRIRENLPDFMEQARAVKKYNLRGYEVTVYEIER
jgi:hypothetical protein